MINKRSTKPNNRNVSILVFVELALDVGYKPSDSVFLTVSILVFVELALDEPKS